MAGETIRFAEPSVDSPNSRISTSWRGMMLSLYHELTTRGACTVKKELQIQQCCAVTSRLLRTVHSATCARFEHPLRYLEESSFMVLFQTAAIEGPSTLNKCSMNPDRTPIPRMPRITDLSQFSTMGIRLSTCIIVRERTWRWPKTFPSHERSCLAARSSPFLKSDGCTIAMNAAPRESRGGTTWTH
jgi:hypothetical protein